MSVATGLRRRLYGTAQRAYGAALRTRYANGGMPWRVHDRLLRVDPAVRHLVPHEPETAVYRFVQAHVTAGAHVLDVGSFLGIYALLEARAAGPSGRVVTVEPTASSAAIARRHLRDNATPDAAPVILVEAAAGAARGQATLHEYQSALRQCPDRGAGRCRRAAPGVGGGQNTRRHLRRTRTGADLHPPRRPGRRMACARGGARRDPGGRPAADNRRRDAPAVLAGVRSGRGPRAGDDRLARPGSGAARAGRRPLQSRCPHHPDPGRPSLMERP